MKSRSLDRLLGSFRRTLDAQQGDDAELLDRYRRQRDLDALESLVRKHGPLVVSACRRVLKSEADIEDAFQATFVVLMNDPAAVRKVKSLGSWLYGVAHRISLQVVSKNRRRDRIEKSSASPAKGASDDLSLAEACRILHEELDRLPDKYRHVLMHCYLEGKSRDEAAAELGLTLNEVRGALERGRERLRNRLEKRGVTLSVGLISFASSTIGNSALAGSLPSRYLQSILGTPVPRPAVAALAQGVLPVKALSLKLATLALVAVGILGIGTQLGGIQAGPAKPEDAKTTKPAKPDQPADAKPDASDEFIEFRGKVGESATKPIAGAKIYVLYYTGIRHQVNEKARTGADGTFTVKIPKSEFRTDYNSAPWTGAHIVARAEGYGVGWSTNTPIAEIRLERETAPLKGRIVNLEGRPIEGVNVKIVGLQTPRTARDLSKFVEELTKTQIGLPAENQHTSGFTGNWIGLDLGSIMPSATTGRDGRFTLPGIGNERLVDLVISGPSVETRTLKAMTRDTSQVIADEWQKTDMRMPGRKITYVGNNVDLALNHGRTVTGVVRDEKTGRPVAGANVYEYQLANDPPTYGPETRRPVTTDREGKYTIHGLPVKGKNLLMAAPPQGLPLLMQQKMHDQPEGFAPATCDFALPAGVPVTIRGVDKVTRKPVKGRVEYFGLASNELFQKRRDVAIPHHVYLRTQGDGMAFEGVIPPGPGMFTFRADADQYMFAVGKETFASLMLQGGMIDTRPYYVLPSNYNTLTAIDPKPTDTALSVTIELESGRTRKGRVVAADGTAASGKLQYQGLKPSVSIGGTTTESTSAEFEISGLVAKDSRIVNVRQPGRKQAGFAVVSFEDAPLVVTLQPWATIRGRLVDADGAPLANKPIIFFGRSPQDPKDFRIGALDGTFQTDADGKFLIEGLTAGLIYRIGLIEGAFVKGYIVNGSTFQAGDDRNLGDMKLIADE
jgi:RNA polymerase sigma factor (sigma-70 family)